MVNNISFKNSSNTLYKDFYKNHSNPVVQKNNGEQTRVESADDIKQEKLVHPIEKQENSTKKLWYAAGGILVGAGVVGLAALYSRNRNKIGLQNQINSLQGEVNNLVSQINNSKVQREALEQQAKLQRELASKLQCQLNDILENNPNISGKYIDELTEKYRALIKDTTLNYDPMKPLKNGETIEKSLYTKYFELKSPTIINRQIATRGCIDTSTLLGELSRLEKGETLKIPFTEVSDKIKIKKAPNASLQPENMAKLGKLEDCDKAINAGITARWDEEKIARDLLQNFYDGHGHTLDGVNMKITKTNSGTYKVRVEGKSTYNCEYISADGLSTKSANLDDAGGFGEGLKMVNVSMLANNLTKKISYGSRDWQYDITAGKKYMQRQLNKVADFDGNFVEFETSKESLIQKLVNATNFFEHSKNPDFKGLLYENADMGIAFLGKEQKGNFYLTQRFAYGNDKGWENNLEGINIFFRRKPDIAFSKGRDRSYISPEDFEGIIKKFVGDISDEKALDIIMDMQSVWAKENTDIQQKGYKILLKTLCEKFSKYDTYGKKIDLIDKKFVAISSYENSQTIERLQEYGYTVCDEYFENIGMPNAREVLSLYSAHNALQPTANEIKKIKLLGEAMEVFAKRPNISSDVFEEFSKINPDDIVDKNYMSIYAKNLLERLASFTGLAGEFRNKIKSIPDYKDKEKMKKIIPDLFKEFITDKIRNIKSENVNSQHEIIEFIQNTSDFSCISKSVCDIANSVKIQQPLIKPYNPKSPVFVFDRHAEKCEDTLAEAMIDHADKKYLGHWVSRDHLKEGSFSDVLSTWLHETLHQYAGDSDPAFGYKLTDLLSETIKLTPEQRMELKAIQKAYEEIK